MQIEVITYTDEKLKYFQDKQKAISKKYENLKAKSIGVSYTSEQMQKLSDYGRELSFYNDIVEMLEKDVVPRSDYEELQKKLNDYKKFIGEIRVTNENHAVIIDSENTEYIDKRVAEGLKNLAVKKAQQEVAKEIFNKFAVILYSLIYLGNDSKYHLKRMNANEVTMIVENFWKLNQKYIGE